MTWLRVDDRILRHPKFVRAERLGGSAAIHLWLAMATWCAEHLTDGEIPADLLHAVGGPSGVKARARALLALRESSLVSLGSDGGATLVDFLQYNPSAADVLRDRDRRAQNQQSYRHRRNVTDNAPSSVIDNAPVSNRVPSRPVPVPSPDLALEPAQTEPPTHTRIPTGWRPSEALYGEAIMAGVPRELLDEDVAYWRARKLGGEFHDIEGFFRSHLPRLARRREVDAAQRMGAKRSTADPNDRLQRQADRIRMLEEQERQATREAV